MVPKVSASVTILACLVAAVPLRADDTAPQFRDYPATVYKGIETPLRIDSPQARKYAPFLRKADGEDINFAGRYVFVSLPAGKGCATGAAIDIKTGHPNFLPFKACASDVLRLFSTNSRSRMIVINGTIDTKADSVTRHYFSFESGSWVEVKAGVSPSVPMLPRAQSPSAELSKVEPAASDQGSLDRDKLIKLLKNVANDPDTGVHWGCYTRGLKTALDEVNKASKDNDSYLMNLLADGGFTLMAERVIQTCDAGLPPTPEDRNIQKKLNFARLAFLQLNIEEDKALFAKCGEEVKTLSQSTKTYCEYRKAEFEKNFSHL